MQWRRCGSLGLPGNLIRGNVSNWRIPSDATDETVGTHCYTSGRRIIRQDIRNVRLMQKSCDLCLCNRQLAIDPPLQNLVHLGACLSQHRQYGNSSYGVIFWQAGWRRASQFVSECQSPLTQRASLMLRPSILASERQILKQKHSLSIGVDLPMVAWVMGFHQQT